MLASPLPTKITLRSSGEAHPPLREACAARADLATHVVLGRSEEGRAVDGFVLGRGDHAVSLIAGNHADEPVGPETLRLLVGDVLARPERYAPLLEAVRLVVVPHTNPDGEARNRGWMDDWPSVEAYLAGAVREPPGRDLEFGFPDLRPENEAVAAFLRAQGPFVLHASLHGMGFAEGGMLLVERRWTYRTAALQDGFRAACAEAGLGLHDHNRQGEKGFFYVGRGIATTPEGEAMRAYFRSRGDEQTAGLFLDSSMEFARGLGGDPLCVVTELPLFLLEGDAPSPPGTPETYLAFREEKTGMQARAARGVALDAEKARFGMRPLELENAVRVQFEVLRLALATAVPEATAALPAR